MSLRVTGLRIIRDILSGQHDPKELAKHRDHRCRKNEKEIAKSLEGDYREELLFTLRQTVELYDLYTEKLRACDGEIERQLACFDPKIDINEQPLLPATRPPAIRPKNDPPSDIRPALYQMAGVDLYRRMKTKLGTPKAVVATAHKLARIVYHMLRHQVSFSAIPPEQEDERYHQRLLHNLQRKAQKLGAKLILETQSDSA